MSNIKWDLKFMNLASEISKWSKDNSTKVGSIIVDDSNRIISTGYNGMPIGCDDSIVSRYERPQKYFYFEHSERNAIYSCAYAGKSTKNATIYVQLYPCADCARAIIQSGIKRVVTHKPDFNNKIWGENWKISNELFNECGILIEYIENEYR